MMKIDMHGRKVLEVEGLILSAIDTALRTNRNVEFVHGFHHGTALKTETQRVLRRLTGSPSFGIRRVEFKQGSSIVHFD